MPSSRPSRNCGKCRAIKRRVSFVPALPSYVQGLSSSPEKRKEKDESNANRDLDSVTSSILIVASVFVHTTNALGTEMNGNCPFDLYCPCAQDAPADAPWYPAWYPPGLPPTHSLCPSVDEIGVNYFLYHLVIGGTSPSLGYLNCVPAIYSTDGEQPTLMASMAAVGLESLANAQHPELATVARAKYWEAIDNVNMALASPTEAHKDSTLMALIALGLFEHVSDFEIWYRHIQGAATLVVSPGQKPILSLGGHFHV
ncbi:hypothetical protein NUU61_004670 [Penicillium alfredii]|uniref:Transcription factor domain-containing protein n=1 Tax=Penicillium alfredii TaxID=1506179 RepID=A0A9W9F891_9EURO|nr:uncharacterized protein NUU61_004670 [Penicillium alfredii]KAJ5095314.1 hypothetical protein NUU61_004670 [Penicillium alfredii]